MHYGYYLTLGSQLAETQDHVSLLWLDDHRMTPAELAAHTLRGKTCVLDVAGCLFDGMALHPQATERLQALRTYIKLHGMLDAVQVLVPIDEPNLPEHDVQHLIPEATRIMREAWPEAKLGCIYYNDGRFEHHHLYDVLGFDDYLGGARILDKTRWRDWVRLWFKPLVRRGSYRRFADLLRPDQRTWLIPGGTYGEPPERWVKFARERPEVWAIVPFLWASNADGQAMAGIRGLPVRAAYEAAGRALMEAA